MGGNVRGGSVQGGKCPTLVLRRDGKHPAERPDIVMGRRPEHVDGSAVVGYGHYTWCVKFDAAQRLL